MEEFGNLLPNFLTFIRNNFFASFISREKKYFLGIIFVMLLFLTVFDSNIIGFSEFNHENLVVMEEFFEFNVALALFFLCSWLLRDRITEARNKFENNSDI